MDYQKNQHHIQLHLNNNQTNNENNINKIEQEQKEEGEEEENEEGKNEGGHLLLFQRAFSSDDQQVSEIEDVVEQVKGESRLHYCRRISSIKNSKKSCFINGEIVQQNTDLDRIQKQNKENFEKSIISETTLQDSIINENSSFYPLISSIIKEPAKQKLDNFQIFTLAFIVFCCHYGYAIEIVFISPYFLKMNPPDIIDSIVWIFPTLFGALTFPFAQFFMTDDIVSQRLRKPTMIIYALISLVGLMMIGEIQNISQLVSDNSILKQKEAVLYISIFGFIIHDIGQETMQELVGVYINDLADYQSRKKADNFLTFSDALGQFVAYFVCSCLAFHVDDLFEDNFNQNFTIAYNIGAVFTIFSIFFAYNFLHTEKYDQKVSGTYIDIMVQQHISLDNFLPGLNRKHQLPPRLQILLISNFLINISLLTVSAYATLWTGISVLESSPNAHSKKIKNDLFDMGVSWGALTLTIASILYYFTSLFIKMAKKPSSLLVFYVVIQIISNFSFLLTYESQDFYTLLLSLPLWGCALSAYNSIPSFIVEEITQNEEEIELYNQLSYVVSLFSQTIIYFFIPIWYQIFDVQDDISISLLVAAFCGSFGTVLIVLI